MRNIGKYRRKKQKRLIIIGSISLLLFLCVGYAAFSTNLKVMTRANIKDRHNLYVASFGSDTKGNGTKEKPYATIEKAYDSAWQNSTIYVMDNITQKSKVTMDDNKDILLTSYSEDNSVNSIIRDSSLTTNLIDVQNGILTLENITINGNDIPSQNSMINVASEVYIEKGTTVTKANNINDWGGGFSVNGGTLTMNDGKISECNSNDKGGAAIFIFGDHQEGDNVENNKEGTFILNGGSIIKNVGRHIIWSAGNIQINGGIISENQAKVKGKSIVYICGNGIITNGEIKNNIVNVENTEIGGVVMCTSYINIKGNLTIKGGNINDNQITNGSALIVANYSNIIFDGGNIMNNVSNNNNGGGVATWYKSIYTYKSGVVCGNIPANQYETSITCPS